MEFKSIVDGVVSLFLLAAYLIHFYVSYSRHGELLAVDDATERRNSLPYGTTWVFLLTTIGLPLFCSLCASWVMSPVVVPEGFKVYEVLPAPFFNLSISVFVLMITIEIGYLYNGAASSWRPYIIAALILDLMALLTFLVVVEPPVLEPNNSNAILAILLFLVVSIGSLCSSCGTIYFAKIHSVIDRY